MLVNCKRNVFDHPKFEHNRGCCADAPKHWQRILYWSEGRCQRSDVLYIKHHQWHHYAEQLQHFCFYSSLFNSNFFFSSQFSVDSLRPGLCVQFKCTLKAQLNHAISSDLKIENVNIAFITMHLLLNFVFGFFLVSSCCLPFGYSIADNESESSKIYTKRHGKWLEKILKLDYWYIAPEAIAILNRKPTLTVNVRFEWWFYWLIQQSELNGGRFHELFSFLKWVLEALELDKKINWNRLKPSNLFVLLFFVYFFLFVVFGFLCKKVSASFMTKITVFSVFFGIYD